MTSAGAAVKVVKYSDGCRNRVFSAAGVHYLSLEHGGWDRNYVMSVPDSSIERPVARPLLIAMHGFGGNGASMRYLLERNKGFEDSHVVLYPNGAGVTNNARGWNSGHPQCCGTALRENVDDVAFLRTLVDTVAQATCVDLNRVYATGFSNGGDMAQRLSCDASEIVAAITSVAGRFDYHSSACPGDRPVPAVLYRGQLDRTVPYDRNLLGLLALKTIPAIEGFEQIARNHDCTGNPQSTLSTGETECLRFEDCKGNFQVTLCTSAAAGHCWPGTENCSPTPQGGSAAFAATDHMREFFSRQALSPKTPIVSREARPRN